MNFKELNSLLLLIFPLALLVTGCASNIKQNAEKEISICSANTCSRASEKLSTSQLENGIKQLITVNRNETIPICTADPKTHSCKSEKICYFVLGGMLPGNGCAKSLTFNEILIDPTTKQIDMKTTMPISFIGTKVSCDTATGKLSVKSANEISIELEPYHCSWMVVGQMSAKFSFYVKSIDLDRGQISGYWNHSVVGTGNGSGSGYATLQLTKNIDWAAIIKPPATL